LEKRKDVDGLERAFLRPLEHLLSGAFGDPEAGYSLLKILYFKRYAGGEKCFTEGHREEAWQSSRYPGKTFSTISIQGHYAEGRKEHISLFGAENKKIRPETSHLMPDQVRQGGVVSQPKKKNNV